mgnify:CR=1 FL=1
MTKLYNDPARFTEDMLIGFLDANARYVAGVPGGVVRAHRTRPGKVAVVIGGGSGHYPAFCGTVGVGFADGADLVQQVDDLPAPAHEVSRGELDPRSINEKTVSSVMYDPDMPDVDLFLRPSGEKRTSNFLLWQSAYAEMIYQDKLFPDFTPEDLFAAVEEYARRDRRFGGVK